MTTSNPTKSSNDEKLSQTEISKSGIEWSNVSPEVIQGILEVQKLQAQNEAARIAIKEKQVIPNIELAKLQVNHKSEFETTRQREHRKNIVIQNTFLLFAGMATVAFLAWCIANDKELFVIDLLKYSLYPLSAGGGYWAGRISRHPGKEHTAS